MKTDCLDTLNRWCWLLLAIAIVAGLAHSCGPVSAATRLVPEEYLTIQSAIDSAAAGDTVLLSPGTYRGPGNRGIEFRGRDLVLKSRNGPEETIIDCERADRGFYLHELESRAARIEGLTIQHGYASSESDFGSGGGIFCGLSDPTIVGCRVLECQAAGDGGGVALFVSSAAVDGCEISACLANRGGGIWVSLGEAEIKDCVITGNGGGQGGGVCFGGSGSDRLLGCTVAANWVGTDGGGILALEPLLLERCVVWGNCSWMGADEIRCGHAAIRCCDIDTTGVVSRGTITYDENCLYSDPMFCLAAPCGWHTEGDWSLDATSACLPEHSPCGELIGALGQGCSGAPSTGACCVANDSCVVESQQACVQGSGVYMGDAVPCEVNTCVPTPTRVTSWGRIKAAYR